jgi:hypothetical protein
MSYHPRIECQDVCSFQTTRTRNSALWFVNNPELEEAILGYAALYTTRHEAKLYALACGFYRIKRGLLSLEL